LVIACPDTLLRRSTNKMRLICARTSLSVNRRVYYRRRRPANRRIVTEHRKVPAAAMKLIGILNRYSPREEKRATE